MVDDRRYVVNMRVGAMPTRAEVRLGGYENGEDTIGVSTSGDEA